MHKRILFSLTLIIALGAARPAIGMEDRLLTLTERIDEALLARTEIPLNVKTQLHDAKTQLHIASRELKLRKMIEELNNDSGDYGSGYCNIETAKELLDAGVDVNTVIGGKTLLQWATENGHVDLCKLLLERGANVNAQSSYGNTAFMHLSIYKRAESIYPLLLNHGAHTHIQNQDGETALTLAAQYSGRTRCTLIIDHQKMVNASVKTLLLCLNRLKREPNENEKIALCGGELYRNFKTLFLPYFGNYFPLKKLLNIRNNQGGRAYDYLQIDCLNPDSRPAIASESGWFSYCSIQ